MKIPKHIGIILDGNRRFAKKLMLKPWKGHEWGVEKVKKLLDWCKDLDIKELTLFAFSMQNFNRPKEEFNYLMNIFLKTTKDLEEKKDELNDSGIKINFIGRIHLFPEELRVRMKRLMELTKNNAKHVLNLAMAYGGREEIIDAVMRIAKKVHAGDLDFDKINEEVFSEHLYMRSEPDLIIRTGGDHRTSNFLIWQANYAEWFFLEKCWPEFEKEDLLTCINEFANRERRFGC